MVKAVLFDVDGVLIRLETYFSRTLDPVAYPQAVSLMNEFYRGPVEQACCRGTGDPKKAVVPFLAQMGWTGTPGEFFEAQHRYEARFLDRPLLARIGRLNAGGLPCYVASNQNLRRQEFLDTELDTAGNFSGVFWSCRIGHGKPEDGFWDAVLDRLGHDVPGIRPGEVLFLDDLAVNIASAHARGMATVWVRSPADIDEGLRLIPPVTLPSQPNAD